MNKGRNLKLMVDRGRAEAEQVGTGTETGRTEQPRPLAISFDIF
jgi:hypothetical protein